MPAPIEGNRIKRSALWWWLAKRGPISSLEAVERFGFRDVHEVAMAVCYLRRKKGVDIKCYKEKALDRQRGYFVHVGIYYLEKDVSQCLSSTT